MSVLGQTILKWGGGGVLSTIKLLAKYSPVTLNVYISYEILIGLAFNSKYLTGLGSQFIWLTVANKSITQDHVVIKDMYSKRVMRSEHTISQSVKLNIWLIIIWISNHGNVIYLQDTLHNKSGSKPSHLITYFFLQAFKVGNFGKVRRWPYANWSYSPYSYTTKKKYNLKDLCNANACWLVLIYYTLIITNVAKRLFEYVPYILLY